jgi:hypothetical protein
MLVSMKMTQGSGRALLLAILVAAPSGACGGSESSGESGSDAGDAASDSAALDAIAADTTGGWVYDPCCTGGVIGTCKCPAPGCGLPPLVPCGGTTCVLAGGVCPADSGVDASGSDGPTLDDAPPGSCNALLNDGTTVTVMQVAASMPTAVGGTIVAGTYHRTAWTRYTGVGGATGPGTDTDRTTAYFAAGKVEIVISTNGGPNQHISAAYSTSGSSLTLVSSCPSTLTSPYTAFDATPTQIVFYDLSSKQSLTYTRK